MKIIKLLLFLLFAFVVACTGRKKVITASDPKTSTDVSGKAGNFLDSLLKAYPSDFDSLTRPGSSRDIQIIYSSIDRTKNNSPKLRHHYYQVDPSRYFYPASTIKLPVAALALQRLAELNVPGLHKGSTMILGKRDTVKTSIEECIKKILLVSDNYSYNYLYDFLGQEYINNKLSKMGCPDAQIVHRVGIALSEEENRLSRPVKFLDPTGKILYQQPGSKSSFEYASRKTLLGKGFYEGDSLIGKPFDFSRKNRLSLPDLHSILVSLITPQALPKRKRFKLPAEDYRFLKKFMSMYPSESALTRGDTTYYNAYVKFLLYGSEKIPTLPGVRIFNKVGDAYGFLIDAAYIVDFKNNVEFFISAVISCNSDGIYNDDRYDYTTVGWPFLKRLGEVVYHYELSRKRKNKPDLSKFVFDYKD